MSEEKKDAVRNLAKGGGILIAGTFTSKAIMYLYRLYVAQELGAADYGILSIGLAVFWITASLTHLGVGSGIQRKITDYIGKNQESKIPKVVWGSLAATIPLSLVSATIMFFSADFLALKFFNDPSAASVIRIFALALPFQIINKNMNNLIKAFKQMRYFVYTDRIFLSVFTLGATAGLIYLGYGLTGAVFAQLFGIIFTSLLTIYFAQKKVYPFLSKRTLDIREEGIKLMDYSWPLFLGGIVGLVMGWTDTILLGFFEASETVGVYNAAQPTAQLLTVISGGLGTMLFPLVSEYYGKGETKEAVSLASTGIKWVFASTFPALILMILFARPALKLLFGETYTGGAAALSILGTAYFLGAMTSHAGSFIKSEDRTKLSLYNSVFIALLNLGLNYLLIPIYSQTGAALATAFASTLGSIIALLEVHYLFNINVYRLKDLLPSLLSTLFSAGIVYFTLDNMFKTLPPLMLIPGGMAFGILYLLFFIILGGLSEDDIIVLKQIDERTEQDLTPLKKLLEKLQFRN